jgi:hypothetical protein
VFGERYLRVGRPRKLDVEYQRMGKPGRPPKFDRPSRLVSMTLPVDVIRALRKRHPDLAHAVVDLADEATRAMRRLRSLRRQPVELEEIAPRQFLIAIDAVTVRDLPGCDLVPLAPGTAFLTLKPGTGFADLALAIAQRLQEAGGDPAERETLTKIRKAFRQWIRDDKLTHETRSTVVLRRLVGTLLLASDGALAAYSLLNGVG